MVRLASPNFSAMSSGSLRFKDIVLEGMTRPALVCAQADGARDMKIHKCDVDP